METKEVEVRHPSWIVVSSPGWIKGGAVLTVISFVVLLLAGAGTYSLGSLGFLVGGVIIACLLCGVGSVLDWIFLGAGTQQTVPSATSMWSPESQARNKEDVELPKRASELLERYFGIKSGRDIVLIPVENSQTMNKDLAAQNLAALREASSGIYHGGISFALSELTPIQFMDQFFGLEIEASGGDGEYFVWHRGGVKPPTLDFLNPGKIPENLDAIRCALSKKPEWFTEEVPN